MREGVPPPPKHMWLERLVPSGHSPILSKCDSEMHNWKEMLPGHEFWDSPPRSNSYVLERGGGRGRHDRTRPLRQEEEPVG